MNNFGVFGIMPLTGPVHNFYPAGTGKSGKMAGDKGNEMPVTPAVLKEKVITAGLIIASLPVVFMVVQL